MPLFSTYLLIDLLWTRAAGPALATWRRAWRARKREQSWHSLTRIIHPQVEDRLYKTHERYNSVILTVYFTSVPLLSVCLSACHLPCLSVFSICLIPYMNTWCPLANHFSPVPHDLSVCLSIFHLLFSICLILCLMPSCLSVFCCSRWADKPGGGTDQPKYQLPRHVRSGYTQNIALFDFPKNYFSKINKCHGRISDDLFIGDRAYKHPDAETRQHHPVR